MLKIFLNVLSICPAHRRPAPWVQSKMCFETFFFGVWRLFGRASCALFLKLRRVKHTEASESETYEAADL
jgi:hypothetical protein